MMKEITFLKLEQVQAEFGDELYYGMTFLEQVIVTLKFFSAVRNTVLWDTRQFLCSVP